MSKVEMLLGGELIKISTDTLNRVECSLDDGQLKGEHTVTLLVYDRFLNCSTIEQKIAVG